MLQVDLRVHSIEPSRTIWRLFPGKGYQFLSAFREQGVGYLDIPGLDLFEDGAPNFRRLLPKIARAQAVREALLSRGKFDADELSLEKFVNSRASANRTRIQNSIVNLYLVAKDSDLVVLPEPVSMSRVWIGQIVNSNIRNGFYRRYSDTAIPARNIKWLSSYEENTISGRLSQSLRNQHPFTLLERSMYPEVLALAFGSFVYGDRHAATIYNGEDFLDSDSALLGNISRLAAAACQALDQGDVDLRNVDLLKILLASPPIEYTCIQESDIHSPGFTRYLSSTETSLVIAALSATLIGLSGCSSKDEMAQQINQIEYVNSSASNDPQCTARVSKSSKKVLSLLGIDQTWELCETMRGSKKRTNLKPTAIPVRRP